MIDTQALTPDERDSLDFRTTDEIADDEAAEFASVRETLTGLPARPSVTR